MLLRQPKKYQELRRSIEWGLVRSTTYGLPLFTLLWIYNMCLDFNLTHLCIFIFFAYLLGINTTAFMHRAWTHRAWVPDRWLTVCALIIHNIGCTGKSITWCAVHRKHHRFSDTEQDPHSPYHKGKFYVATAAYSMNFPADYEYAKDLTKDPVHMWFFKYYWWSN